MFFNHLPWSDPGAGWTARPRVSANRCEMISHDHECVFVHVPKCAGQSIESVFLRDLGLTWETRSPLLLHYNPAPGAGPPRLAHLTLPEYRKYRYLSEELLERYFKFAFVRNPWDRVVSFYRYFHWNVSFPRFVESVLAGKLWREEYWFVRPQSEFILDEHGNPGIDFLGHHESLQSDFMRICKRLGLEADLPRKNASSSSRDTLRWRGSYLLSGIMRIDLLRMYSAFGRKQVHRNWRDYYDPDTRAMVGELYRSDIELLNYEFD